MTSFARETYQASQSYLAKRQLTFHSQTSQPPYMVVTIKEFSTNAIDVFAPHDIVNEERSNTDGSLISVQ